MNTIKNIFGVLLALAAMSIFYSCEDEVKYTPADKLNSAQVYFPNTNSPSINLSSIENSFEIAIARLKTDEAITVPLTVTGTNGLYNFPASVSFAQGESTTVITITYDPSVIEFDDYIELTLSIADDTYATVYGMSEYTFSVGIPAPWETLGRGSFYDDFQEEYAIYTGGTSGVEIQQHMLDPTRFRFTSIYENEDTPYVEFKILPVGSVYKGVTTTIKGLIVYDDIKTYYSSANGGFIMGLHPSRFTNFNTEASWAYNCVTKFSVNDKPEVVEFAPYFYIFEAGGGWNQTTTPVLKLVFPDVALTDYSIEIDYAGTYTDASNEVAGVLAQIDAVGEDVKGVRLAVVEGTDAHAALDGIKSGNIDYVEAPATTGTVLVPFASKPPVGGDYMIVAVTYADNMAQGEEVVSFTYTPAP